jgi:hypothetical protein
MKKISVVAAAALILTALGPRSAAAQRTLVPGVKGGLSISTFGEPWSTLKNPTVGAFLSIGLNKVLSVQPEVFWLTQGGAVGGGNYYDEIGNYVEIEYRWKLSYVHIPVLCKLCPIPKGTFRPVIFAGPAIDILARAVEAVYYNVYDDQGEELYAYRGDDVNIRDTFNGTNWDLVAGAGLEVLLNKARLVVEVRYTQGLTNIYRQSPDTPLKTRALMFLAGVGF